MQKVKHDFQLVNKEISSGNVHMIQNCFTLFLNFFLLEFVCSYVETVNCMRFSELIYCNSRIKLDHNHALTKLKYTQNTKSSKHNNFL